MTPHARRRSRGTSKVCRQSSGSIQTGSVLSEFEGFIRADWEALSADMSAKADLPAVQIDWASLPAWRPGCGSKHLDPADL